VDDACGGTLQSEFSMYVTQPGWVHIAIEGHNGACGDYVLAVEMIPNPDCPCDITGDGYVDVLDLLFLLSHWGYPQPCPADVNGDGLIDVLDLLDLLSDWGPCP
jgi:hypothetical protein